MSTALLVVFLGSVLISFLLTRSVRNMANARGWVSAASSPRHIHKDLVPRLGGIAIFIAFNIVALALVFFRSEAGVGSGLSTRTILFILGSGSIVFVLGLYDDFRPVKPAVKFAVQAAAATLLFVGGYGVFQLPLLFGSRTLGWLALPLTILWVLWITNAFNLLDGVDGLASGSALFSTLTVFVVSLVSGGFLVSSLSLVLAGAILGFLRFNFNPATIFLGDSGSLFIGFILSALALTGAQKAPTLIAVAIPVVSFGLPLLETVLSVIRRFLSGQPLFGADRGHIHHKLLERGFSQRQVVLILYAVSVVCGLLSLVLLSPSGPMVGVVLFVIGTGIWVGVQRLGYHEFNELGRVAHRTMEQKRIIVNNLAIRRATEALSKAADIDSIGRILRDAFEGNDFDGFELTLAPGTAHLAYDEETGSLLRWIKSTEADGQAEWRLGLDLKTSSGRKLGDFSLYRRCNGSALLVDVNLLIDGFNTALWGALERAVDDATRVRATSNQPLNYPVLPDVQPAGPPPA